MLEKILFKKLEVWVLGLILLLTLIGTIMFGSIVRHVALGGNKAGKIGDFALLVASSPNIIKNLVKGPILSSNTYDPNNRPSIGATKEVFSLEDLSKYTDVFPEMDNSHKYLAKENAFGQEPLAVQSRINDDGDGILAIFNENRELEKIKSMKLVKSMVKTFPSKGNSPIFIFDDGSYIVWPQGGGVGLFRFGVCGEVIWQLKGIFHHQYSIDNDKLYILGLPGEEFSKEDYVNWNHSDILNVVNINTGKLLQSVSIKEIAEKNLPNFDPFFYERWKEKVNSKGVLSEDFIHLNKIEVLPQRLWAEYPELPEGALLVSARHINLLFIMDPKTLEIVWYSHGKTQVQHDPEFIGNNRIAVFNNSYDKNHPVPSDPSNFTSIKTYDLTNDTWSTWYNMKPINGYTAHSGTFDISKDGSLALHLTLQGKIVEVNATGEPVFEYISYRDEKSVYWQEGAQYLTQDAYSAIINAKCGEK